MATKNSFVLRNSYADIFADLSDKQAGALIKVIFNYVAKKDVTEGLGDVEVKMAWKFIKQDIDYDCQKYADLCSKRAEYGKQGGRPKANAFPGNQEKHKVFEKAKGFSQKHIDSDVVSDSESEDDFKQQKKNIQKEKSSSKFTKPTLDDVAQYCAERKNSVSPLAFFDFYESKGWKIGNTPMKDWQAAVRTWERRKQQGDTNNGTGIDWNKNPQPGKYAGLGRKIG